METMTKLTLRLYREWFDKIKSGEKKEEYREWKSFYRQRIEGKQIERILFLCGRRQMEVECTGWEIRPDRIYSTGREERLCDVLVLKLGRVVSFRDETGEHVLC